MVIHIWLFLSFYDTLFALGTLWIFDSYFSNGFSLPAKNSWFSSWYPLCRVAKYFFVFLISSANLRSPSVKCLLMSTIRVGKYIIFFQLWNTKWQSFLCNTVVAKVICKSDILLLISATNIRAIVSNVIKLRQQRPQHYQIEFKFSLIYVFTRKFENHWSDTLATKFIINTK